jgi:lysophospholipase L1-like esterase
VIERSVNAGPRRLVRWGLLVLGLSPLIYGLMRGVFWFDDRIPKWAYWKAGLIFLIALKVAYVTAFVAAAGGTLALGVLIVMGRRWASRRALGRGLLACVSLLIGLAVAESATAIWQYRARRTSAMPIGGFRRAATTRPSAVPVTTSLPALDSSETTPEFPDPPADRQIDLVIVGESSAEGVPLQRWLSIDRIVAWQLEGVIPDRPIHVQSLAMSGETLEQQHRRLVQLERRPEIVIIYCGHNEFKARFSSTFTPDYYLADRLPGTSQILMEHIEGLSPFCGLIAETAEKCRLSIPPSSESERNLIDVPVYSAAEYATLLADFKRRLDAMVSYTERFGAIPILIVPPANDAGFAPNRSFLPPSTPRGQREAFQGEFLAATRLEQEDAAASIARYRELLKSEPRFAESHYRLARLLERAGSLGEAYFHYVAARDNDGYPMRCMTPFQDAYREVAARHKCLLIDGQAYFRRIGRRGQLDDELFVDMMHPSLRGYIALSQAILRALKTTGALGWPPDVPASAIDPALCVAHFGLDGETWKHLCAWQRIFNELVLPIRYDRSQRLQKRMAAMTAADRLSQGTAPEALGLPNVGIPEVVPLISYGVGETNGDKKARMP